MNQIDKVEKLNEVAHAVEECRKCSLWKNPKAVPGEGNPDAEMMLIGEAPGYHESIQGRPFVGAAGQLLTQLLESINLKRSDAFICNMLRHRPPENREPLPEEIEACKDFLNRQIEIIGPKAIVTLGRFAMAKFLPLGKISRDHGQGRMIEYNGKRLILIPMFHPAAALRGAEVEKMLRDDFKKILGEIKRLEAKPEPVAEVKKEEQLALI